MLHISTYKFLWKCKYRSWCLSRNKCCWCVYMQSIPLFTFLSHLNFDLSQITWMFFFSYLLMFTLQSCSMSFPLPDVLLEFLNLKIAGWEEICISVSASYHKSLYWFQWTIYKEFLDLPHKAYITLAARNYHGCQYSRHYIAMISTSSLVHHWWPSHTMATFTFHDTEFDCIWHNSTANIRFIFEYTGRYLYLPLSP